MSGEVPGPANGHRVNQTAQVWRTSLGFKPKLTMTSFLMKKPQLSGSSLIQS